ncbi:hypothetical protein HRbin02_00584 [Candidatus Calditenuaceae archaeon HR02]|nr:hypothetical protein HRbin02_00584 [Candidatus Calditenuaceae archaeon HR02]
MHTSLHRFLSEWRYIEGMSLNLPSRGTYVLVIVLRRPIIVRVGRLGRLSFKRGVYVYVGTARRGLGPRIRRHLAKRKRLHWHIDWVTSCRAFEVCEVWVSETLGIECKLATELIRQADGFVPRFGSSDCRCRSHFVYISCGRKEGALHRLGLLRVI